MSRDVQRPANLKLGNSEYAGKGVAKALVTFFGGFSQDGVCSHYANRFVLSIFYLGLVLNLVFANLSWY